MHQLKWQQKTKRFILTLVSLLTGLSILITGVHSYAVTPDAAYLVKIQGNGLLLGEGASRNRQPARVQTQIRGNNILYVPGNGPWAYLGFIIDAPLDSAGLLVKAGPSSIPSEWSFPCTARGGFTIAWKKGRDRGCETGVQVQRSNKKSGLLNHNNFLQASRNLIIAQVDEEVIVVPNQKESLIQTSENGAGIVVDVLLGEVQIKSAKYPQGRPIKAGESYSYPQDIIRPLDPNSILNTPAMQDFLNPDNWKAPDLPERVANNMAEQVGEMQTALSQSSPTIASNSGNNNLSELPTTSNPETSQPKEPDSTRKRSGELILEMGLFKLTSSSCEAVSGTTDKYKIFFTEHNNQFTFSAPPMVPMTTGTMSLLGDNLFQFDASGPSPIRWNGTFRGDGNYYNITGTATCMEASQPFTLTGYSKPN